MRRKKFDCAICQRQFYTPHQVIKHWLEQGGCGEWKMALYRFSGTPLYMGERSRQWTVKCEWCHRQWVGARAHVVSELFHHLKHRGMAAHILEKGLGVNDGQEAKA